MIAAERDGLSGEDKYALLAYHMMHAAQRYFEIAIDLAERGTPMMIVPAEGYNAAVAEAVARLPKL